MLSDYISIMVTSHPSQEKKKGTNITSNVMGMGVWPSFPFPFTSTNKDDAVNDKDVLY